MEIENKYFCSIESKTIEKNIFGSAPVHNTVFLIEYNKPWTAKALLDSSIPDKVKDFLVEKSQIKGNKVLLIKREHQREALNFFFIRIKFNNYQQYAFSLQSYEDILKIDFENIPSEKMYNKSMLLVCTNGKKDKCCSKFGFPFYQSLNNVNNDLHKVDIWQCSHFGGDRFAATALLLPYGFYFGRLNSLQPDIFLDSVSSQKIIIEHFRGSCLYNGFVQAAEYYIRKKERKSGFNDVMLISYEEVSADMSEVILKVNSNNIYRLVVKKIFSKEENFLTCTALKKQSPPQYQLIKFSQISEIN